MSVVELKSDQPLHQLLALVDTGEGVKDVRRLAALSVGNVDAKGASILGKTVADWATADLEKEIEKAFSPDPFALMAKAWAQVREVRKAIDASRGPPPKAQTVALLKHEIEAKMEPRLVLNVTGVDWCDVKLALSLKMSFESVQIELNDGHISALKLGNPSGQISLKCAGQEVAAFKREIKIAQAYKFAAPVAMPMVAPEVPAESQAATELVSHGVPIIV
jgi:hypothetical protein